MEATTVAAQGSAEASYDHAGFNLTLLGLSTTPTSAKRLLADAIAELNSTLDNLKTNLSFDFVKNSLQTNSGVQPKHEWETQGTSNVQVFRGYEVYYNMYFEIDNLDLVSKVYDALTSLDSVGGSVKVNVSSPSFSITPRTRERLNKKALKKAWEKVEERFETECDVLALDPAALEVATWEVSYSDSRRSNRVSNRLGGAVAAAAPMRAAAMAFSAASEDVESSALGGGDAPIIEIQIGQATVTVNLEVGFARKADAKTIKAQVVSKGNHTATAQSAGSSSTFL
jgi:acyl-coenzyme A thioesterase PaaI-like protein